MTTLVQKLCEVMASIDYIPKTGYNKQQGYKYAQEADVVEKVRVELAKRKVFLLNSVEDCKFRTIRTQKGGELTIATLTVRYTLLDGETQEKLEFYGIGEGMDAGDKAVYKAQTGALKYALMKTFLIPTGDDPERDDEDTEHTQPEHTQPAQVERTVNQPIQRPQALASDKQRKMLFSISKKKGLDDDQLKELMKSQTGKESTKELTKQEASDLITLIQQTDLEELILLIEANKTLEEYKEAK